MKVINAIIFTVFATQESLSQSGNYNYPNNPYLNREYQPKQVYRKQGQSLKPFSQDRCIEVNFANLKFQNEIRDKLSAQYGINLKFSDEIFVAGQKSGRDAESFKHFLNKDGFEFFKMAYYGVSISGSFCEDYESTINNIVNYWGNQVDKTVFNDEHFAVIKQNEYWNLFVAKKHQIIQSTPSTFNKPGTTYRPEDISPTIGNRKCQATDEPPTSFDVNKVLDLINLVRSRNNSPNLEIDSNLKQIHQNFQSPDQKTYRYASKKIQYYTYNDKSFTQTFCDGIPMSFFPVLEAWSEKKPESLLDPRFRHFTLERNGDEWIIILASKESF